MPTREPKEGKCAARVRNIPEDWDVDEAFCNNVEGFRVDNPDAKRCYLHGGSSKAVNEGNNHAEKHGLYMNRQNYYKHRSEKEQNWIDAVTESILEDMPESEPSFMKLQMVRNIAIDMHKMQRANDYVDDVGVVHRDKTTGYTDDGRPIKEDVENPINIAYDRLNKTITRQLKELSVLESPDKKDAEAKENLSNELSKLRQARGE